MTRGQTVLMAFVKAVVFDHLSQQHLERLQRMREELERELALRHSIDNGHPASLRDYWRDLAGEEHTQV